MKKKRTSKLTPEQKRDAWVRNQLRRITIRWPDANKAKKAARVGRFINPKSGRLAWHSMCALCKAILPEGRTELDHTSPIVPLEGGIKRKDNPLLIDWNLFIERAFVFAEAFRVLCESCHLKITNEQKAARALDREEKE